jgi:hypothetical protein
MVNAMRTNIPELAHACSHEQLAGRAMRDHCEALTELVEAMDPRVAVKLLPVVTGIVTRATELPMTSRF